jgi:WD40 repeat protein
MNTSRFSRFFISSGRLICPRSFFLGIIVYSVPSISQELVKEKKILDDALAYLSRETRSGERPSAAALAAEFPVPPPEYSTASAVSSAGTSACPTPDTQSTDGAQLDSASSSLSVINPRQLTPTRTADPGNKAMQASARNSQRGLLAAARARATSDITDGETSAATSRMQSLPATNPTPGTTAPPNSPRRLRNPSPNPSAQPSASNAAGVFRTPTANPPSKPVSLRREALTPPRPPSRLPSHTISHKSSDEKPRSAQAAGHRPGSAGGVTNKPAPQPKILTPPPAPATKSTIREDAKALKSDHIEVLMKKITQIEKLWPTEELLRGYLNRQSYAHLVPRFSDQTPCTCLISGNDFIQTFCVSPDGKKAFLATESGQMKLFDISNPWGPNELAMKDYAKAIKMELGADGYGERVDAEEYVATEAYIARVDEHVKFITASHFSGKSDWLITGSKNGSVLCWCLQNLKRIKPYELSSPTLQHEYPVLSVSFSHDALFAVSGSGDNSVIFYDARSIYEVKRSRLLGHTAAVTKVSMSKEGDCAVSAAGGNDFSAIWWDFSKYILDAQSEIKGIRLHNMEFSPKDKAQSSPRKSSVRRRSALPLTCSPDCKKVFTAEDENTTYWDITNKRAYQLKGTPDDQIISLAFMEDRWLITGSCDGRVTLFVTINTADMPRYQIAHHFPRAEIDTVALATQGRMAVFAAYHRDPVHRSLVVCDLDNLQNPLCFKLPGEAFDVRVAKDVLLTRSADGTVLRFDLRLGFNVTITELARALMHGKAAAPTFE